MSFELVVTLLKVKLCVKLGKIHECDCFKILCGSCIIAVLDSAVALICSFVTED